jgi:O-glycosyl hydrolase
MNESQKSSEIASSATTPCRHLRCKEMFYQGSTDGEFSSGIYWCVKTQENTGPDGQSCSKCECGPERACYQD